MEDLKKIQEFFSKDIKEQADHVAPMVVKAYKEYLEAKKEGNGEKAYRYYSKKLNNTYTTRADRDAIEAILKKKYGSALEEMMSLDDQAKAYYLEKFKKGEISSLPEDPKAAFLAQMTKDQIAHDKETLRRERGLEEGKQLDIEDFAKVVQAVTKTGHPVTVLLTPKFNEIEVLTGMNAPDDMLFDLSNAVDSLGYGRNDIIIAGDSSNLSRREYSDIRRVNGGHKDYFEESVNEEKKLTYNDFVRMVRDDMMAGAAPDERPSEELVGKRAKAYYNEYLQGASLDDIFEAETNVSDDIPDIIAVDVPLFIRLLEFAREDAGDDMDLHEVAERAIEAVKLRGVLSMDDYDTLVAPKEEIDEALIVTKSKIDKLARQVAAQISKQKNTRDAQEFLRKAIEDAYAKVFDADEYEIKENALGFSDVAKFGREAESKIDYAVRGDSRYTFGNDPYTDDQLRYEYAKKFGYVNEEEGYSKYLKDDPEFPGGKTKGLTPDVMNKILMKIVQDLDEIKRLGEGVIEEELCPKGKAYIKKRMAAGEKSSAYLSGRAVKVCKGQMEG